MRSLVRRDLRHAGFTLIEVLVTIALLGLISVPLAASFIGISRGVSGVDSRIDRSADAQRIGAAWNRDVLNLRAGGVNSAGSCPSAAATSGESQLVTFTWDSVEPDNSPGDRFTASWIAAPINGSLALIRTYCINGTRESEDVLARRIGAPTDVVTDIVHGPDVGNPRDFCPFTASPPIQSRICTIIVNANPAVAGTFNYRLSVTRRVFDDGSTGVGAFAPPAPTGLTATGRNTYISTTWTPLSPADGQPPILQYQVFAYTTIDGTPIASALTTDSTQVQAIVSGLQNLTPHWVRVQARNAVGWGDLSAPVAATPVPTPPDASQIASATPGDGSVTVAWGDPYTDGGHPLTGWWIYAKPASGPEVSTFLADGNARSGPIGGLTNGVAYTITVAAVNTCDTYCGVGLRSEPSPPVTPFGPPVAPNSVVAQAGESQATVRWAPTASPNNGRAVLGYVVFAYRGVGSSSPDPVGGTYVTTAAAGCSPTCELTLTGLTNASYYRFAVSTRVDVDGTTTIDGSASTLSEPFPGPAPTPVNPPYVRPSTAPGAVASAPTAAVSGTNANLTYTIPGDGGAAVTSTYVEWDRASTATGATWTNNAGSTSVATSGAVGSTAAIAVPGLSSGYKYRFRVAAANRGEWFTGGAADRQGPVSPTSAVATFTTAPGAPTSVTLVRTGTAGKQLTLSFGAPADTGGSPVTSYSYSCTSATLGPPPGASGTVSTPGSFTLTGLKDGRAYTCTVTATTAAGTSPPATSAPATPYSECTLTITNSDNNARIAKNKDTTRYTDVLGLDDGSNENWSFVKWDVSTQACSETGSALPGASYISSSQLRLYVNHRQSTNSRPAFIADNTTTYPVKTTTWKNSDSWDTLNSRKLLDINYNDTATGVTTAYTSAAITARVRTMFSTPAGNNGFAIVDGRSGGDHWVKWNSATASSNKPMLYMQYFSEGL